MTDGVARPRKAPGELKCTVCRKCGVSFDFTVPEPPGVVNSPCPECGEACDLTAGR